MKLFRFLKSFFVVIICVALCLLIFGSVFLFFYIRGFARFEPEEQAFVTSNYSLVTDNFYSDGSATVESIDLMNDFVKTLPANISKVFYRDWKVVVAEEIPVELIEHCLISLSESEDSESSFFISGICAQIFKVIFIKTDSNQDQIYDAFVHEIGHCFDCEFGSLSFTDEFKRIYTTYKDSFVEENSFSPDGYVVSTSHEFFATVFKEYFLYPVHLKENAVNAYNYFETSYRDAAETVDSSFLSKYDAKSALIHLTGRFNGLSNIFNKIIDIL